MTDRAFRASFSLPLIAAPAAWGAELLLGWYATTRCCSSRAAPRWPPSSCRAVAAVVAAITIGVLAVALCAAIAARRNVIRPETDPTVAERRRFLATAAVFVAATLLLGTAWAALGSLAGDLCGAAR